MQSRNKLPDLVFNLYDKPYMEASFGHLRRFQADNSASLVMGYKRIAVINVYLKPQYRVLTERRIFG